MACWFILDIDDFRSNGANNSLNVVHSDTGGEQSATTSSTYTVDTWQHGCAVFTSNSSRTIYLNGGNDNTNATAQDSITPNRTSIGVKLGPAAVRYWSGSIAEAAIWNAALTAEEVAVLGSGYSPLLIRPQSLVSYWPLMGRIIGEQDIISKNTLTLQNSPATSEHVPIIYPKAPQIMVPQKDNITDSIGRVFATDAVVEYR
jgi:hypothetical protein